MFNNVNVVSNNFIITCASENLNTLYIEDMEIIN